MTANYRETYISFLVLLKMVHKTSNDDKNVIKNVESESVHVIERKSVIYKDLSSTLVQEISDYSKQFAHIYAARLAELGEVLTTKVHAKWSKILMIFQFILTLVYRTTNMYFILSVRKCSSLKTSGFRGF